MSVKLIASECDVVGLCGSGDETVSRSSQDAAADNAVISATTARPACAVAAPLEVGVYLYFVV